MLPQKRKQHFPLSHFMSAIDFSSAHWINTFFFIYFHSCWIIQYINWSEVASFLFAAEIEWEIIYYFCMKLTCYWLDFFSLCHGEHFNSSGLRPMTIALAMHLMDFVQFIFNLCDFRSTFTRNFLFYCSTTFVFYLYRSHGFGKGIFTYWRRACWLTHRTKDFRYKKIHTFIHPLCTHINIVWHFGVRS